MDISDSFTVLFLSLLIIIIYINNMLFGRFLASKPEGRKTILGKMPLTIVSLLAPKKNQIRAAIYKMIISR
jgi:hypothetical protein